MNEPTGTEARVCADCGATIGQDKGPPDGWKLEDGHTVCHACCVKDLKEFVSQAKILNLKNE